MVTFAPETPVHLRELQANIAAAHNDEMAGHLIQTQEWQVLVKYATPTTARKSGSTARPPISMKMREAVNRSAPTLTVFGASNCACP